MEGRLQRSVQHYLNHIYNFSALKPFFFLLEGEVGGGDRMTAPLGFIESDERSEERVSQCEYIHMRELLFFFLKRDQFAHPITQH